MSPAELLADRAHIYPVKATTDRRFGQQAEPLNQSQVWPVKPQPQTVFGARGYPVEQDLV